MKSLNLKQVITIRWSDYEQRKAVDYCLIPIALVSTEIPRSHATNAKQLQAITITFIL